MLRSKKSLSSFFEARQVTNIFTGLSMCSSGLGVLIAPKYLAELARKFNLAGPTLNRPSLKRVIAVYTRKNHALSPGAGEFLGFIQKFVDGHGFSNAQRRHPRTDGRQ